MSNKGRHFAGTNKKANNFSNPESKATQKKFKKIFKFLLILICILIIATVLFLAYSYFINKYLNTSETSTSDEEQYTYSEKVEISQKVSVRGAEYLEITGLYINSDNSDLSTISARLKNTSDKSYENLKLRITLYDEDKKEIVSLDYKINKVDANGEAITYAALKQDLSNCKDYSIALQEPTK